MTEKNNVSNDQRSLFHGDNQIIKDLESKKQEFFKKHDVLFRRRDGPQAVIKMLQLKIISFYK